MPARPRPSVDFRSGVRDRIAYAARWLRTERAPGERVRVAGEPAALAALSHALWVGEKEAFVPHAMAGAGHDRPGLARTPIWLGAGAVAGAEPAVLVNIGTEMPQDWSEYARIVEIVPAEDPGRRAGRVRYASYRDLGAVLAHREVTDDEASGS